jgi:hypothetical protein
MSAASKPQIFILLHVHLCASCGKPRVCEDKPCWLPYRNHVRQWAWTCAKCGGR